MSEFAGKTVLITGSGRGIGRHTAMSFAADGANVCINYAHSADEARQTAAEIESSGGKAITCKADISDSVQVDAMVTASIDAFGAIDILINNAGLSIDSPFLEMHEHDWDRVYEVNLKGPFLVSQAVARHMLAGNGGVRTISSDELTANDLKDADLIVMGSRGMSDSEKYLLGSVSHKVTSLAECPVLGV